MKKIIALFALVMLIGMACKRESFPKDVAFSVLYSGNDSRYTENYQRVINDNDSYISLCDLIGVSNAERQNIDYKTQQVIAVFDTARPQPLYDLRISKIQEYETYIKISISRVYNPRDGKQAQAYSVVRMPYSPKNIVFENLPFQYVAPEYKPEAGVSACLNNAAKATQEEIQECFVFQFREDGRMAVEHRGMVLNCGPTIVSTSSKQDGDKLIVTENEGYGADSILALCVCQKNVGYFLESVRFADYDSLLINYRFTTFDRGLRTRSFKIPTKGSGKVAL